MERDEFAAWLDRYVAAWKSYEPAAIGDLFAEDASYHYDPFSEPVHGRAAIVQSWLQDQDAPGTYDATYEPFLVTGDVGVATGRSQYFDETGALVREFGNIFVCRFDPEGRCREFREWWMKGPEPAGTAPAETAPAETAPAETASAETAPGG